MLWHGNECGKYKSNENFKTNIPSNGRPKTTNVENTKVMRISRQTSPVTIDQKQLENVECFKYLGSMLTNDGRCTCETKSRIAMAKPALNKKKNFLPAHWT